MRFLWMQKKMLPYIDPLAFPAQSLAVALYKQAGVRGVEIGSFMFGKQPDGSEKPAKHELLRLAIPRRTYNKSHFDYIADSFASIMDQKDHLKGLKIVWQPNDLRHFTARFEML